MTKYRTQKLKGKIHVKHGFPFKSEHFAEKGDFVVVTPGNFYEGGGFKRNAEKDKCYTHGFPKEYLLRKNDLVVAMTEQAEGLLGSTAKIPCDGKFLHNQRIGLITATSREIDLDFIYHLFKINFVRRQIKGSASGTKVKHTSPERISDVLAPIPDKITQSRIAAVLSTLDAKIEINHRLNEELEGLAKLLYDYWFVQFDFPISADQAAAMGAPTLKDKPYRQSGGKMTYNPTLKREIPEGWRVASLPDIATFTNGIACQKYPANGDDTLRVIKIKEMRDGFTADSDIVTSCVPEKVKIYDGDLLFSWSASLEVMIWSGGRGALNQHIFKVTSDSHPRSFCYFTLLDYLKHFQMMANLRKTTMGHITIEHLDQSRIALPPAWLTDQFEEMVNPLIERMLKSHAEIHEIAALRDWLLPMLMNGQVSVGK